MTSMKMDLDAIDRLAWFRIIYFLDGKSRLQCRRLSRTIKKYVDLKGLTIRINRAKPFANRKWKAFLKNPDICFSKVYYNASDEKSDISADSVGLTRRHSVTSLHLESLKSRSLNEMTNLLKADWTQNVHTLVFGSYSSALDIPLEENVSNIELPGLQQLYLTYFARHRCGVRRTTHGTASIVNILLRKIQSNHMELVFVNLSSGGSESPTFSLPDALVMFVNTHARTLQTIIFKNSTGNITNYQPGTAISSVELTEIPHRLKYFDVDFFGYLDPSSSWFKMLNTSVRQLKTFVNRCHIETEQELSITAHPSLLPNLCRLNCNTLSSLHLTIRNNHVALDLNVFKYCNNLEHLELEFDLVTLPVYLKNITMLPISIKSFYVAHDQGLGLGEELEGEAVGANPRIALELEEVTNFQKLKNLVSLYLYAPTAFKNSEQLVQFTKTILRLPKLDFFELDDVYLIGKDTPGPGSLRKRRVFYDKLCENDLKKIPTPGSSFKIRLTVSHFNPRDGFDSVYYEDVHGSLTFENSVTNGLSVKYHYENVLDSVETTWPPALHHSKFQIENTSLY